MGTSCSNQLLTLALQILETSFLLAGWCMSGCCRSGSSVSEIPKHHLSQACSSASTTRNDGICTLPSALPHLWQCSISTLYKCLVSCCRRGCNGVQRRCCHHSSTHLQQADCGFRARQVKLLLDPEVCLFGSCQQLSGFGFLSDLGPWSHPVRPNNLCLCLSLCLCCHALVAHVCVRCASHGITS